MRVFVTGATGFIGSAIVQELMTAGHQVLGLVRNDAGADALARLSVASHRGELADTESLAAGARACDGTIHTAFIHDFKDIAAAGATDRRAVEALGAALTGSGRPLVITSGTALVSPGRLATEDDVPPRDSAAAHRVPSEDAALAMASHGVRSSIVRPPPTVHGDGDHGFVPMIVGAAREKGVSAYVGDGLNRWPAVHRLDAAHLYRLALENGSAGARFHAVAEEGIPFRDIAEVIGRRLNVPVAAMSPEEAVEQFGWIGHFLALDCPASSAQTQQLLGWHPSRLGLIADLEGGRYFD